MRSSLPVDRSKSETDTALGQICAVCISRHSERWSIDSIPFFNYTEGWKPYQHEKTRERVAYLAKRRNIAVERALSLHPRTEHILMIDSYYLHQEEQIAGLINEYDNLIHSECPQGCILGASTWIFDKTRVRSQVRFYDGWTTPEGLVFKPDASGLVNPRIKANAVGGCYLYPRKVWERVGYSVPEDLHGCEHNWLCEHSELPVFLSLNERLWRDPLIYSWPKRIRMSLHLRRLILRRPRPRP